MNPSTSDPTDDNLSHLEGATSIMFRGRKAILRVNLEPYKETSWGPMARWAHLQTDDELDQSNKDSVNRLIGVAFRTAAGSLSNDEWDQAAGQDPQTLKDLNSKFAKELHKLAMIVHYTDQTEVTHYNGHSIHVRPFYPEVERTTVECMWPRSIPAVKIEMVDKDDCSKGISQINIQTSGMLTKTTHPSYRSSPAFMSEGAFSSLATIISDSPVLKEITEKLVAGTSKAWAEDRLLKHLRAVQERHVQDLGDGGESFTVEPADAPEPGTLSSKWENWKGTGTEVSISPYVLK